MHLTIALWFDLMSDAKSSRGAKTPEKCRTFNSSFRNFDFSNAIFRSANVSRSESLRPSSSLKQHEIFRFKHE